MHVWTVMSIDSLVYVCDDSNGLWVSELYLMDCEYRKCDLIQVGCEKNRGDSVEIPLRQSV